MYSGRNPRRIDICCTSLNSCGPNATSYKMLHHFRTFNTQNCEKKPWLPWPMLFKRTLPIANITPSVTITQTAASTTNASPCAIPWPPNHDAVTRWNSAPIILQRLFPLHKGNKHTKCLALPCQVSHSMLPRTTHLWKGLTQSRMCASSCGMHQELQTGRMELGNPFSYLWIKITYKCEWIDHMWVHISFANSANTYCTW